VSGLVTSTEVSSEALPPAEADFLAKKTEQAGMLGDEEPPVTKERQGDELLYAMTVEKDGSEHTVRFTETTLPEEVRSLIAWLDARPERRHSLQPSGGQGPK
jgi:hypothetical protein